MKKFLKKFNKNVLFFCPSIEEGGVEKNLMNIANNLFGKYNIAVLTSNTDKKKYFNKKIKFISPESNFYNKKNRIIKSIICTYFFFKFFKKKKLTLVSFQSNIVAIILAKIFKKKVIIRSNTSPSSYTKNFLKKKIMKFFYAYADHIIVNSKDFSREFKKIFSLKTIVIYNPIEEINVIKKLYNTKLDFNFFDKDKKSIKLLAIGRLVDQKDHITILRSLNHISKKIKLCIIGKGEKKKELLHYIKANNLSKKVKLIGFKNNIYPYIKKSDIFILSSKYEGLPNSLIEAKTCGIEIISTNCKTGPREILKGYKRYNFFRIGDYKRLSNLIESYKKTNTLKKITLDKKFEFKQCIKKYQRLIEK